MTATLPRAFLSVNGPPPLWSANPKPGNLSTVGRDQGESVGAAHQRSSLRLSLSHSLADCLKLWTQSGAEGGLEILITLELTELSVTHIRVHWPNYAGSSVIAVNRKVKERQMTISPPRLINCKQAGQDGGEGKTARRRTAVAALPSSAVAKPKYVNKIW